MRTILLPLLAALASACTSSVSTLQTARTLAPGHVQITGAAEGSLHSAALEETLEAADRLTDELTAASESGQAISEDTQREATEAALALALFTPSVTPLLAVRVGVAEDVEIGGRYTGALLGLEGKYQLRRASDAGPDVALLAGFALHLDVGPSVVSELFDLLSLVQLDDYQRNDVHLGVIVSRDYGKWLSLYGAARYMASFWSLNADFEDVETATGTELVELDGTIHATGAAGGLFIGYAHVFVNLEVTAMHVWFRPEVLGVERDLDGWVVAPAAGLTLKL